LAKNRYGALIVFEKGTRLQEYVETGEELDALISNELLVSIFQPKSPLHDGAVVIRDQRIVAAGVVLPHTFKHYEPKHNWGTRHKAAIGLAENSDAEIIVISEERKTISYASHGDLREVTPEQLQNYLEKIYKVKKGAKVKTPNKDKSKKKSKPSKKA